MQRHEQECRRGQRGDCLAIAMQCKESRAGAGAAGLAHDEQATWRRAKGWDSVCARRGARMCGRETGTCLDSRRRTWLEKHGRKCVPARGVFNACMGDRRDRHVTGSCGALEQRVERRRGVKYVASGRQLTEYAKTKRCMPLAESEYVLLVLSFFMTA